MKKIILFSALLVGLNAAASPDPARVTEQVLKAFKETFKHARDITWHNYQDYFQANFHQNQIQVRAQYADDGTLLKTIRYYDESELPANIVARIKRKYAGKEIKGVTETTSNEEISYVVNLHDNDHWYIVQSDAFGNLEQTDKFKRADK